jgi:hypothetical protein
MAFDKKEIFETLRNLGVNNFLSLKTGLQMELIKNPEKEKYLKNLYFFDDGKSLDEICKIYETNSIGYRCDEILENRDFVFSGCSFTFGIGVPKEGIWGVNVAKGIGLDYYNLGIPGESTAAIVDNLFSYFKLHGNPKILMCMFPDIFRKEIFFDQKEFYSEQDQKNKTQTGYTRVFWRQPESPKYSKKPHLIPDIIPKEIAMMDAINSIKNLEIYCYSNNIKFLWSTWDDTWYEYITLYLMENKIFKNFVDIENLKWHQNYADGFAERYHEFNVDDECKYNQECKKYINCHLIEKNYYGKVFDLPFDKDINDKNNRGHSGVHKHIHWAEKFISELENYDKRILV